MRFLSLIRPSRCLKPSEWLNAIPLVIAEVDRWERSYNETATEANLFHLNEWIKIKTILIQEEKSLKGEVKIFGEDQLLYPIQFPDYLYGRLAQLLASSSIGLEDREMLEKAW